MYPVLQHVKKKLAIDNTQVIDHTNKANNVERFREQIFVVEVLGMASFLDPRFKDRHLHDKKEIMECITEQCLQYYQTVMSTDSIGETSIPPGKQDAIPAKRMRGLAAVIKHIIDDNDESTLFNPATKNRKRNKCLLGVSVT